jgi:hypothetical protein
VEALILRRRRRQPPRPCGAARVHALQAQPLGAPCTHRIPPRTLSGRRSQSACSRHGAPSRGSPSRWPWSACGCEPPAGCGACARARRSPSWAQRSAPRCWGRCSARRRAWPAGAAGLLASIRSPRTGRWPGCAGATRSLPRCAACPLVARSTPWRPASVCWSAWLASAASWPAATSARPPRCRGPSATRRTRRRSAGIATRAGSAARRRGPYRCTRPSSTRRRWASSCVVWCWCSSTAAGRAHTPAEHTPAQRTPGLTAPERCSPPRPRRTPRDAAPSSSSAATAPPRPGPPPHSAWAWWCSPGWCCG